MKTIEGFETSTITTNLDLQNVRFLKAIKTKYYKPHNYYKRLRFELMTQI